MLKLYGIATEIADIFIPIWLWLRKQSGKEDPKRLRERYGYASKPRPKGALLWIHAASVGEANSVLELIKKLKTQLPHLNILLTTGTVTSARLMAARLPKGIIHQYVPLDIIAYTRRFMRHWKPEMALFVESELWPNLIITADAYQCFMGIINGRMSERSYVKWQKHPEMINHLLSCFNCVFAQSEDDAQRLKTLGARHTDFVGNLKYDAALLPCNEDELLSLQKTLKDRPIWLAASTHPGEEQIIAQTHKLLAARRPNLLTIIVPRHPSRGGSIAAELSKEWSVVQRSEKESVESATSFYIADTLGELGLFYRLSEIVFMGGSLVKHGGQNPLEAARLSCAIVTGPHTHNFASIYNEMEKTGACLTLQSEKELAARVDRLLNKADARNEMEKQAKLFVDIRNGAADKIITNLLPVFTMAPE